MVFLKVLQADLQMQLPSTSHNMFTRLLNDTLSEEEFTSNLNICSTYMARLQAFNPTNLNHRVRLGQALKALHQLGQVSGVLGLHSHSHHRTDTELHDTHVVCMLKCADGACLHQVLINSNQTNNVSTGHILDGLRITSHHEDGSVLRGIRRCLLEKGSKDYPNGYPNVL